MSVVSIEEVKDEDQNSVDEDSPANVTKELEGVRNKTHHLELPKYENDILPLKEQQQLTQRANEFELAIAYYTDLSIIPGPQVRFPVKGSSTYLFVTSTASASQGLLQSRVLYHTYMKILDRVMQFSPKQNENNKNLLDDLSNHHKKIIKLGFNLDEKLASFFGLFLNLRQSLSYFIRGLHNGIDIHVALAYLKRDVISFEKFSAEFWEVSEELTKTSEVAVTTITTMLQSTGRFHILCNNLEDEKKKSF